MAVSLGKRLQKWADPIIFGDGLAEYLPETRIKGLIRLLGIALRVLCLVEFTARKALQEQGAKLDHIYAGNPKRATAKPTTEMMLLAFRGLSLNVVNFNGADRRCMTPLNAVQTRILGLIGFPTAIYQGIEIQSG